MIKKLTQEPRFYRWVQLSSYSENVTEPQLVPYYTYSPIYSFTIIVNYQRHC